LSAKTSECLIFGGSLVLSTLYFPARWRFYRVSLARTHIHILQVIFYRFFFLLAVPPSNFFFKCLPSTASIIIKHQPSIPISLAPPAAEGVVFKEEFRVYYAYFGNYFLKNEQKLTIVAERLDRW
jgi:hypothetical protein